MGSFFLLFQTTLQVRFEAPVYCVVGASLPWVLWVVRPWIESLLGVEECQSKIHLTTARDLFVVLSIYAVVVVECEHKACLAVEGAITFLGHAHCMSPEKIR